VNGVGETVVEAGRFPQRHVLEMLNVMEVVMGPTIARGGQGHGIERKERLRRVPGEALLPFLFVAGKQGVLLGIAPADFFPQLRKALSLEVAGQRLLGVFQSGQGAQCLALQPDVAGFFLWVQAAHGLNHVVLNLLKGLLP